MSEESWYGDPDYMPDFEDQMPDCDYGISEFCEDPMARLIGCTVNCNLYFDVVKTEEGYYDFAIFINREYGTEWSMW